MSSSNIGARRVSRTAMVGAALRASLAPTLLSGVCVLSASVSYLLFHTLVEMISIAIAMTAVAVATVSYRFSRNHFTVYLAIGIGWCAGIDLVHLLLFKGMFLVPTADPNYPTQLWIAARSIEALTLVSGPFFLQRGLRLTYVYTGFGLLSLTALATIAAGVFPDCYIDGKGLTPFKINAEYMIIVVLITSLAALWHKRTLMSGRLLATVAAAIVATVLSEFAFTRYVSVYAAANLIGHVFKIFAFWYIYLALVDTTLRQPFDVLARAASTYDAVPDPTFIVLADGTISQANRAAGVTAKKEPAELVGGSIHKLFHDASTPKEDCPVCSRMAAGATAFSIELHHASGAGAVECSVAAFGGAGGPAFVQVIRDIAERKQVEVALQRKEQYLNAILNNAGDPIFVKDDQSRIILANDAFCSLFELRREDVLGKTLAEEVAPHERERFLQVDRQVLSDGRESSIEETLTHKGKSTKTILTKRTRYTNEHGVHFLVGLIRDISERKQLEETLQLAASVFTHAREGITITDASGTIVNVNDTFTRITGYSREEAVGQNPRILKSGRQPPEFYTAMWATLTEMGYWYGEIWNRRKNGEVFAEMLTISAVCDAAGKAQHYVGMFTDITSMKEHQQQLERIAHFDALTNLPNRVLLADRMKQAMLQSQRRGSMLAVAYLDLDGFKEINDIHGHDVGDQMLISLSQYIKEALREGDTLARVGGDEFVAVLVDLQGPRDCEPVLDRLLQAAARAVTLGDVILRVSASIGVAVYPQAGVDADMLLRQADHAMYLAKESGKNSYHLFDVNQAAAIQTQRESLDHIRHALDQHEFVLYYQPKVNMRTGAVVGTEALIRWQHPQRGRLAPALFLPTIEGHPISVELGEWVIDAALKQISAWHAVGLDMPVSVNIGAHQLQRVNFVERLAQALAAHPKVHPGQLELEILETSALADVVQVGHLMQACHNLGVAFALDDFGTGYSSLTHLRHLPATLLKIDQSFVRDMLSDADDLAIVKGVIGLAGTFHCSVIAEGVETEAHGAKLLALGCELAQGYGIAQPMPADEIPAWVQSWQAKPVWTA